MSVFMNFKTRYLTCGSCILPYILSDKMILGVCVCNSVIVYYTNIFQ